MHLGNGAITPECGAIAIGVATVGTGLAWYVARKQPVTNNQWATFSALTAFVFAAQMFNIDIFSWGAAHLVGGVFLAWSLGPALGVIGMALVLAVQAIWLGDGGVLALGANIVNMAIVPAAMVMVARNTMPDDVTPLRTGVTIGLASFLSIVAAAVLIVGEVALFRSAGELEGFGAFASQMFSTHAVFGLLEAATTIAVVSFVTSMSFLQNPMVEMTRKRSAGFAVMAMLVAVLCIPAMGIVSTSADGYTAAVQQINNSGTDW